MAVFNDIKKAIENSGKHIVAARVVMTDSALLTADVIFEGEQVIREKVPIRIFTDDDGGLGMGWIPKLGSEVLVAFIDGEVNRPQIIKVQQWDQLIVKKGATSNPDIVITIGPDNKVDLRKASGFQFTIDSAGNVSIGNAPSHKLGWADQWLIEFNAHTHPTPTGPSGPPMQPLVDTDVNSQIFTVE